MLHPGASPHVPKYAKLEFLLFDGKEDPSASNFLKVSALQMQVRFGWHHSISLAMLTYGITSMPKQRAAHLGISLSSCVPRNLDHLHTAISLGL